MPISPATPAAGYFKTKRARNAPWCPVRFWYGPPPDPVTGEPLDRSHRWQAELAGTYWDGDVLELFIQSAKHPIDESEYRYMLDTIRWARRHDPAAPEAAPGSPIDLDKLPPLF